MSEFYLYTHPNLSLKGTQLAVGAKEDKDRRDLISAFLFFVNSTPVTSHINTSATRKFSCQGMIIKLGVKRIFKKNL